LDKKLLTDQTDVPSSVLRNTSEMISDQVPSNDRNAERLTQLEEFCTFLQRTVNELDQVVLSQQRRIDSLEARLSRLTSHLERVTEQAYNPPLPEDEKPPHY